MTIPRFFSDKKVAKDVKLTKEEQTALDNFEWEVLCHNGFKQINGSYSEIEVLEMDEEDNQILICSVKCGVEDEHGRSENQWTVKFNRKTLKFSKV